MKKIVSIVLCLVLAASLCACARPSGGETTAPPATAAPQQTAAPETTAPADTQPPEESLPQTLQLPMSAISLPTVVREVTAEDGTVIFRSATQDVSLTLPDASCADIIITDLLNRMDRELNSHSGIPEAAQQDYTGAPDWTPYRVDVLYEPLRIDEKVLSLDGMIFTYNGGAHPAYTCVSANYDIATGKALKLKDVLTESGAQQICIQVISRLAQLPEETYLFPGYDTTVEAMYSASGIPGSSWSLTAQGLQIRFSPYEIAPYATGEITLVLPYDTLEGILSQDYFPASLPETAPGTVTGVLAQDVELESFSQFSEAVLDADGEQVVLFSDGLTGNITLEAGTWDENGIRFFPTATVFLASTLTPGDAVLVYTYFSDVMPHLRLRYTSGGENYSYFLYQSGKDGSIIMLEDLT